MPRLQVTIVTSVHPLPRDLTTAAVVCDVPDAVVLRYDLGAEGLRRVVSDFGGLVEDVRVPLEHACLGCAQREEIVPTVAAIAANERWSTLVLALPVGGDPTPVVAALTAAPELQDVAVLRGVVAAVDAGQLVDDLLGEDLLSERGLGLGEDDERAVGEALAEQLAEADVVLTDGVADRRGRDLMAHVCGPRVPVLGLEGVDPRVLTMPCGGEVRSAARADPLTARRHPVTDTAQVWTLELVSPRPFHSARLLERIEDLGAGRLRARGTFRITTRPHVVCAWEGAGGQLSVGEVGPWSPGDRGTHLVVTGTDWGERRRIQQAFAEVLATREEEQAVAATVGVEDGFEPWLGDRDAHLLHDPLEVE
ncbi:GTP-binding protein [Kineococcus sp. TBRC 1896]|uniref:GTP-binding protein n=1 Tax=Kineococcus mangrovi TaxID=1660183 RepID=A0ABV4I2X9_9ACTN